MRLPIPRFCAALFAAAVTLPSCTTTARQHTAETQPSPPPYDFIEDIPMESTASVQRPSDIRAYPVGRYVDAANKDVLHERHVIYRRERPEQWRLNSDQGSGILLGPTVGLRNPVALPNPSPQALSAELNTQRLITRQLLDIQQRASAGDERARELLIQAAAMRDNQEKLLALVKTYNTRLDSLQHQLDGIRALPSVDPGTLSPAPKRSVEPAKKSTGRPAPVNSKSAITPATPAGELEEKPGITLPFQRR